MQTLKILFVILFFRQLQAQENLLINTYNRTSTSLNGKWNYIVDPYKNGYYDYRYDAFDKQENPNVSAYFLNSKPKSKSDLIEYDFSKSETINVPGDWNSQDDKLFYYEGTIWYKKSFDYVKSENSNRVFIYFGAANYIAEVYLNGKKLGKHEGGFTPFSFEVTELLQPKDNFVIVKVDDTRKKDNVPTLNTDWWNYGGLTRDVKLIETASTYIQDYFVQLNPKDNKQIKGYVTLKGDNVANKIVTINIPELKIKKNVTTDENGKASIEIKSKK